MENVEKEPEAREGFFGRMWKKFGEVAKRLGLISDSDIEEALAKQQSGMPGRRIGEILVEDEKITMDHVDRVLKNQKKGSVSRKKTTAKKAAKKKAVKTTAKKAARTTAKQAARTTAKKAARTTAKQAARTTAKKAAKNTAKKASRKTSGSKKR